MTKEESIKELLMSSGFMVINKKIMKIFGAEGAVLLSCFVEAEEMFADEEGWFFQTIETIIEQTGITRHSQDKYIKKFEELGVLQKEVRGLPAKRFFRLNYSKIDEMLTEQIQKEKKEKRINNNNMKTTMLKTSNYVDEFDKNKEHIYKEHKDIDSLQKKDANLNYNENFSEQIEEIINYLNNRTNKSFSVKSKETVKLIKGRLNEGYNVEDFKKVIDNRCEKWLNDEKMKEFLRPSTLFRPSNFENYLNDVKQVENENKIEKEKKFIEKYKGILLPKNLKPDRFLELYKQKNGEDINFEKMELKYEQLVKKWQKEFEEKRRGALYE